MANMSYCRFRNTLSDLLDCEQNWNDIEDENGSEAKARADLLNLCIRIVSENATDEQVENTFGVL